MNKFHTTKTGLFFLLLAFIFFVFGLYYALTIDRLVLQPMSFNELSNWDNDNHIAALNAFRRSCTEIVKRDPSALFAKDKQWGRNEDWQQICLAANEVILPHSADWAKKFFEHWFVPHAVYNNFATTGLFTGYYLPLLHTNLKKEGKYTVPIYGMPTDLISVNLKRFQPEFANKSLVAQLKKQSLLPYPDRAAINSGIIQETAPVLMWCDSIVDLFFAQIQGSAIAELPDGKRLLIGYAGQNGRPYTSIAKILMQEHGFNKKSISMQAIRTWLAEHPAKIEDVLNRNASYVFFRVLNDIDPTGSEDVPLTRNRSLAVDTRYIPLGTPLWVDTTIPQTRTKLPYQHLLIAQDTGGSIKGIVRGDIYWGAGEEAAFIAGHMKNTGRYWLLLPRHLTS